MPMSDKGKEAMHGFMKKYGEKKGKSVAYATANERKSEGKGKLYSLLHGMK